MYYYAYNKRLPKSINWNLILEHTVKGILNKNQYFKIIKLIWVKAK